ncbi:MAG: PAS domain S-box protein, partial [Gammaproteobacteria bacterium]|nr:PAS domain S-box protein [Gammaproteobacteria bacterium]
MNNKPTTIAFVLLLLFICGSIWLVFEYVSAEKQRDLDDWQARLNIMAESQQHSVENWFSEQAGYIHELANNPLLQLYASQMTSTEEVDSETSRGQLQHLKNLINATADHAGIFTSIRNIKSNQQNRINDGIAIADNKGILLATRYFPIKDAAVAQAYNRALKNGSTYISNIYDAGTNDDGMRQPRLIMAVPVSSVQPISPGDFRAVVIAVINPESSLYTLLLKEWVTTKTEESLLVFLDENSVNYLSPLKGGFEIFHKRARITGKEVTAEEIVTENIGSFTALQDYRRTEVLATARLIRDTSMMLVQKIDVDEALVESKAHQTFILTIFLLLVFVVTISFIAIWRHATSLHLQKATRRLKARAELLNAIGDSINDHIFLLDHKNKLVFINDALAKSFAIENIDIRGKALNHIFNSEITSQLLAVKPGDSNETVRNIEMRLAFANKRHDYHVSVVPLSHSDYKQSHLFVMHDITRLKDAQGRHNRLMDGIIATLAQVIDKHDPHCAHHSERTREVAVAIAKAMGLPRERIESLAMAALLANIGKLYIPAEMLTNVEPLNEEQELMLRENT